MSIIISNKKVVETWEVMFGRMVEYKKEHGHCDVAARNGKLGRWVAHQRSSRNQGRLKPALEEKLNSIGFRWSNGTRTKPHFFKMCGYVEAYVKKYGTGWIPATVYEFEGLGPWAKNNRNNKSRGRLSQWRIEALEKAGFVWEDPTNSYVNDRLGSIGETKNTAVAATLVSLGKEPSLLEENKDPAKSILALPTAVAIQPSQVTTNVSFEDESSVGTAATSNVEPAGSGATSGGVDGANELASISSDILVQMAKALASGKLSTQEYLCAIKALSKCS